MPCRPMCDYLRPWSPAAWVALVILLFTSGCERIPRDPDGTLERVAAEGSFRVGVISPGPDWSDAGRYDAFMRRLAERSRAQPRLLHGPTERLLAALENAELDLVIGELSADSPWRSRVTMLPPLEVQRSDGQPIELTVAARNGENAWIAMVFDAVTMTHLEAPAP